MTVATLADAPAFQFDGVTFRPLAVPSRGSTELAVWRAELPPGKVGAEHSLTHEEILIVLKGTVTGTIGGRPVVAGPGDAVIFPANTPGRLGNTSDTEPAEFICCTTAGIKGFIGDQTITPPWSA
ncbi:cupin domain-containing protein [Planotetraspora sp. GP83]|uniref:cupin domain-containing protein n=1 Tax=Planotetraspora sp. GP83 TaxID=3156264 RepID=UPI003518A41C